MIFAFFLFLSSFKQSKIVKLYKWQLIASKETLNKRSNKKTFFFPNKTESYVNKKKKNVRREIIILENRFLQFGLVTRFNFAFGLFIYFATDLFLCLVRSAVWFDLVFFFKENSQCFSLF